MSMKWRKSPEALVRRFSELVPEDPRVSRRQMFGYPCAFVAGNLFMGLHQDAMILRLSDDDRATFLGLEGAAGFEPMPGRPMREYVVVPPALLDRTAVLSKWVRRALDYASAVPPKKAGRGTKSARRRAPMPKRPTRRSS
jgi:TfoX/Sxy family transcriptional regulator of competence genes